MTARHAPWLAALRPRRPARRSAPYPGPDAARLSSPTPARDAARPIPRCSSRARRSPTASSSALSDACAAAFAALGVRRGDRVALLLPNCPQFFIAEFGAWKIGAIVAPLNPIYTEHELEGPLREHGVETIVTLTRFYQRVKRVQPRTPAPPRHRDQHQGVLSAAAAAAVHAVPREARRRSRRARARRSRLRARCCASTAARPADARAARRPTIRRCC